MNQGNSLESPSHWRGMVSKDYGLTNQTSMDEALERFPVLQNCFATTNIGNFSYSAFDAEAMNRWASSHRGEEVRVAERHWLRDAKHVSRMLENLEGLGINIYSRDGY